MVEPTTPEGLMPGSSGAEEPLFVGHPAALPTFGALLLAILTLGIYAVVGWIRARGTSYRITTRRIVVETGIFSKHMEQIDLYRVVDYVVDRPFGQRLMGTGNLTIEAMDKTTAELRVVGIRTDVVKLYEHLRYATELDKKRRGVRLLDVEAG